MKTFISYCWTSPAHEEWVINLAERLVSNGIDVAIDKWDLKEGMDKFTYMESMVMSTDIDKVLIILDKKYSEKADKRSGGVGTETQIISPKIYSNVSQEKFIPIVAERDSDGNAFIPTYLEGRIYIDLSSNEQYEENFEMLLRNLYKRPMYNKPKLGKAPDYIFEETPMNHKTSFILRGFDMEISKTPNRVNSILRNFLDEFYQNLKDYSVKLSSQVEVEIGKQICDNIQLYTPLRNDFINFIDKIIKSELDFDIDIIIKFLEKLPLLLYPQDQRSSWSSYEFDNFRFMINELFLYLITIGLKNERYKFIEELLYSSYFLQDKYDNKKEPSNYEKFYHSIDTINLYYKQSLSQNFFSPMADLMIKRIPENFSLNIFVEADLLCYYIGKLNGMFWFPKTYVYKADRYFELFDRLVSARHFEKVKIIFNVNTAIELKDKIEKFKADEYSTRSDGYSMGGRPVIPIYKIIDFEKIASTR